MSFVKNLKSQKVILITLIALFTAAMIFLNNASFSRVSATDVDVKVTVGACFLDLTVYPEKRLPAAGNWSEDLLVEVFRSSDNSFVGQFNTSTDANGFSRIDFCAEGLSIPLGFYDFYITGDSHLKKQYTSIGDFAGAITTVDLTAETPFLAGEVSNLFDNYINILDVSKQISTLETVDGLTDLNNDGEVNVLDLSISITNLYKEGECSPLDVTNGTGIC